MAKIKFTKNELKAQRDALARFRRFLPTLLLKKQQLQIELRHLEQQRADKQAEETAARTALGAWVKLFAEPVELDRYLRVAAIRQASGNIAGVSLPVFQGVEFERSLPDLFATPAWLDDGLQLLEQLIGLRAQLLILEEAQHRLEAELRITSQRVNLFEKVKIPQTRENIRVIRIFLGDEMTAAVGRSKIAKTKQVRKEYAGA